MSKVTKWRHIPSQAYLENTMTMFGTRWSL